MKRRNKMVSLLALVLCACMAVSAPVMAATDINAFPESYRESISQLVQQHPNWTLIPFNSGISWTKELLPAEYTLNRNLIEGSSNPTWYRSRAVGCYDPLTGKYTVYSAPDWYQAHPQVISHYLDPRNHLTEDKVFMFEQLSFNAACHTAANVEQVLKGSFMYNKVIEDEKSLKYSEALVRIGKACDISPFLLASRLVQEQGAAGTSPLISGTYKGFEGYYNYFNIGASGNSYDEIYRNGLTEAKNGGWNTRYKALEGGAKKIASRYTDYKQNTLYFQKFDVARGTVSWREYMQNVQAPTSEGERIYRSYRDLGLLNSSFTFYVPVYTDMPAQAVPLPTQYDVFSYGDVDVDDIVTVKDALMILKYVVGTEQFNDRQLAAGDVDDNKDIDVGDALSILKRVVGVIKAFPVEQ